MGSLPAQSGLFALVLAAGCATTDGVIVTHDEDSGMTEYASKRTVVGNLDLSAGLASGQRIVWQAVASCQGMPCLPEEVTLILFNDSSRDLNMDYRGITIAADGVETVWSDFTSEDIATFAVPRGEFLRVNVAADHFLQIVEAREVAVSFGLTASTRVPVPRARREAFRQLAVAAGMLAPDN